MQTLDIIQKTAKSVLEHEVRNLTWRLSGPSRATLAALLVFGATPAHAKADITATAGVDILDDSRVTKTGDLIFGRILAGTAGGTVIVEPDADFGVTGSVTMLGGTQPASFNLSRRTGVDYLTYTAPIISDTIEITHQDNPAVTMTVRNFTTDFNRTRTFFGFFTIPDYFGRTSYDFRVGGTLDVGADQLDGVYTGTFTVSVEYN